MAENKHIAAAGVIYNVVDVWNGEQTNVCLLISRKSVQSGNDPSALCAVVIG